MKRIVHLTTVHLRNDTRILLKECCSLSKAGYDTHLIVGDGNGDQCFDGVQIHDVGVRPISRMKRMWIQPHKAVTKLRELNPSLIHFHDPELLPLGIKFAKQGKCVIYDAHEDLPRQNLTKEYIPKIIRPFLAELLEFYENWAVRQLSAVVTATPHIQQRFLKQGKTSVNVNNYPIIGSLGFPERNRCHQKQVCYIGCISRLRGLLQVVRALPFVPEVRLVLCGSFDEANFEAELRKESGWQQVEYLGQVDRVAAEQVMRESFAGLVTFLPVSHHIHAQPNKLFEYMSAGLPVIASNFVLWKEIIERKECGFCVDPGSSELIAGAIKTLLDSPDRVEHMGRNGYQAVLNQYHWESESKKLLDLYKVLI